MVPSCLLSEYIPQQIKWRRKAKEDFKLNVKILVTKFYFRKKNNFVTSILTSAIKLIGKNSENKEKNFNYLSLMAWAKRWIIKHLMIQLGG